jgi:translation initiation factor IF-3
MILNEKIKAQEVQLTGIDGEDLGIMPTKEALRMAKELGVDLVCLSLTTSPPPCQLVNRSDYRQLVVKENAKIRKAEKGAKMKELRLSAYIEDHDYDTKKRQAERILTAGDSVQLTVRLEKKETQEAKRLVERLVQDLSQHGKQEKGIQISGKQVTVVVIPL